MTYGKTRPIFSRAHSSPPRIYGRNFGPQILDFRRRERRLLQCDCRSFSKPLPQNLKPEVIIIRIIYETSQALGLSCAVTYGTFSAATTRLLLQVQCFPTPQNASTRLLKLQRLTLPLPQRATAESSASTCAHPQTTAKHGARTLLENHRHFFVVNDGTGTLSSPRLTASAPACWSSCPPAMCKCNIVDMFADGSAFFDEDTGTWHYLAQVMHRAGRDDTIDQKSRSVGTDS
jgi:hypothetical protein